MRGRFHALFEIAFSLFVFIILVCLLPVYLLLRVLAGPVGRIRGKSV